MRLREFLQINKINYELITLENLSSNRKISFEDDHKISDYFKNKNVVCYFHSFFYNEIVVYIN